MTIEVKTKNKSAEKSTMCALRLDPPKNFDFKPKNWPMWIENFEIPFSIWSVHPVRAATDRHTDLCDGI